MEYIPENSVGDILRDAGKTNNLIWIILLFVRISCDRIRKRVSFL